MIRQRTFFRWRAAVLTLALLGAFSVLHAGVSGTVTDAQSSAPLAQAWVRFGAADSTQTDASGYYSFPALPSGVYAVVVRHAGYANYRSSVTLIAGLNYIDFAVSPLPDAVDPVGRWLFENPAALTQAEVGQDLVLQGSHEAADGPDGTGAVRIGPGSYYHCYHGIAANGGSSDWVNEYTLLIDFRVSQLGRWYTFFQTSMTNSNDGDAFINTNGNIGVGVTGYSSYAVLPGEWYRLIISVDLGSSYKYYLDGQMLKDGGVQLLNGRFALYPSQNGNQVLFFADENGEDNLIDVAQVAIYDRVLTAAQAAALNGYGHVISDPASVMTPYLQTPTPTSMSVSWHYAGSTQSFVDYGTTGALGLSASGTTISQNASTLWHTVQLTNLQPGTVYYYRCRSDTAVTAVQSFRTPPPHGSRAEKVRFLLISDSQTNVSSSTEVASAMRQTLLTRFGAAWQDSVQLILHCGDIVGNGLDLGLYQTEYFLPFRLLNQSVPFMVSIGNHEAEATYFYNYMKYEPFAAPAGESTYAFQIGRVLFMALNSNTQGTVQADWCNAWLQAAQADTSIDMVFVATHRPGHSEVWPDGNTAWVQNTIMPILDSYSKVVQISFGHSHNYERGARPGSNVRTLLCGGAGGTLDRWRMYNNQTDYPEIHRSFDYRHYVLYEVDPATNSYEATAYTLGNPDHALPNSVFDHWRHALGRAAPPTPSGVAPAGNVLGDVTLTGTGFSGVDSLQSSQFQLTATPGNYTTPLVSVTRDFENYYNDTGSPNYTPIDRNAGIVLNELARIDTLIEAHRTYGWRVRYRDSNLKWSDWSMEQSFVWLGPDTGAPAAPVRLTVADGDAGPILRWSRVAGTGLHYNIYRDMSPTGPFSEWIGTTTDTVFTDSTALAAPALRFYLVKAARP